MTPSRHDIFQPERVLIFFPEFDRGGIENTCINLALGLGRLGCRVELLVGEPRDGNDQRFPEQICVRHCRPGEALSALLQVLEENIPTTILAPRETSYQVAITAARSSRHPAQVVLAAHTMFSTLLKGRNLLKRLWFTYRLRCMFRSADRLVAISNGVAADVAHIARLDVADIMILPNPVISDEIFQCALQPTGHPSLDAKTEPVILGVGRFSRGKDFGTLIKAFAITHRRLPCRLVLLGDGRQRRKLEALARELGVADRVLFPGFVSNPYAYMARADVLAVSSRWEGFCNVLVEAMALGLPVVSTNCPCGPAEILHGGEFGRLTPVGDADELAQSLYATMSAPLPAETLKHAVQPYTIENSAMAYRDALNLQPSPGVACTW